MLISTSTRFRLLAVAVASILLSGCATLEAGADHARDFAKAHPAVTALAVTAVMGGIEVAANGHTHHPPRADAGSCVVIVQTLEGPIPKPCH